MNTYTIFDSVTGRILRTFVCKLRSVLPSLHDGEDFILGSADDTSQYVDPLSLEITDKPGIGAVSDKVVCVANGVDVVSVAGLPNPTHAEIAGPVTGTADVDDGTLEITFDLPGTYTITLSAINCLNQKVVVDAS